MKKLKMRRLFFRGVGLPGIREVIAEEKPANA